LSGGIRTKFNRNWFVQSKINKFAWGNLEVKFGSVSENSIGSLLNKNQLKSIAKIMNSGEFVGKDAKQLLIFDNVIYT